MQHVIIVIHLMLVLSLIGVVLLQRSEGGGLGIGSSGGFMTSRGTANVLTRATAILAGLFFATSLMLSILAGYNRKPTSILGGSGATREEMRAVLALHAERLFDFPIARTLPLANADEAQHLVLAGGLRGRIVLEPGSN
jgi:preprotein translocase subunit SecG